MKLICPECGKQYDSGKFCPECGVKLQEVTPELVCPSCGYKAKSGKFCPECGTKLAEQNITAMVDENRELEERKFNERDERFAKYYDKKGFPRQIPQEERAIAIEELTPFTKQDIAEAKMLMGSILMTDTDRDNVLKGFTMIKEAEQAGDKFAYYFLSYGYYQGWEPIVEQDHNEAEKRLLELYNEYGEAAGLAELYAFSETKCDYKKAFEYASIAAEDDEEGGYAVLGALYLNGWGVDKNEELALENYKMAAAMGNETAMNQIGFIFMGSDGIEANPEQTYFWFNEAAKKGSDVGAYNLGYCYKEGFGVECDVEKAAEWYKKAAELGYVDAMYELGEYYNYILIDYDKAQMWYKKAAELGCNEAQKQLNTFADTESQESYVLDPACSWILPEGTTVLDNALLPEESKKWRESIKIIQLPNSLESVDIFIDEDDCESDLFAFPNLEKVIIPNGEMERFCNISFFIDNQWSKVWYDNGSHVCPEVLPLIEKLRSEYEMTLYSQSVITNECPAVDTVIVSPSCKEIAKKAFKNQNIRSVYMFDGVQLIGKEAFLDCKNLTEIRLSSNIKIIPQYMLQNCYSIKTLIIPEGVSIIEAGAFSGCTSLETIYLPSTIIRIEGGGVFEINPFSLCGSLTKIVIPKGMRAYFQGLLGKNAKYIVEV